MFIKTNLIMKYKITLDKKRKKKERKRKETGTISEYEKTNDILLQLISWAVIRLADRQDNYLYFLC